MKKFVIIVLGLFVLAVAGFFGYAATLPDTFRVERTVVISAEPTAIYQYVGDLTTWKSWTAWTSEKYPDLEYSYGEKTEGVGAVQEWTMEGEKGRLELTSAEPARGIAYDLDFGEGQYRNEGMIEFEQIDGGTRVSWSMTGTLDGAIERFMGQFFDRMVGPDFETGLGKLKEMVEAG